MKPGPAISIFCEARVGFEAGDDLFGDGARVRLRGLGRGERAVALELREVGAVGGGDVPVRGVEALGLEGVGDEGR